MVDSHDSEMRTTQVRRIVIFAIIIAIVSALILAALLVFRETELMQTWTPLVLTIEFGLVVILLWAIASSWRQERSRNKSLNRMRSAELAVTACPDYWTASSGKDGAIVCTNVFSNPLDPKITYTIQGSSPSEATRTINLSEYDGHTVKDVCDRAVNEVAAPWSAVSPMCSSA